MIAPLRTWHGGLNQRERILVAVAAGLAAIVVLVYGIILPVGAAFNDAYSGHAAAVERSGRLIAELDQLKTPAPRRAATGGPVDQQVAASAEAAGFVLQSNQARGGDSAVIVVPTARAAAVLAWIDSLAAQGIVVDTLTVSPAADGSVAVNATLRRAGP